MDLYYGESGKVQPPFEWLLAATLVPNYGTAGRKWWWSGPGGATAAQLTDVINGKAWGNFKKDNIKKKIVALVRRQQDGRFRFVLNEWKPGEAWWWGNGATIANIKSVLNDEAWASFRKDAIDKRLVMLKRHAHGNWTFVMLPRDGLGWAWYPKIAVPDSLSQAKANDHPVIGLHRYDLQQSSPGLPQTDYPVSRYGADHLTPVSQPPVLAVEDVPERASSDAA
jgi:hypothetical protein